MDQRSGARQRSKTIRHPADKVTETDHVRYLRALTKGLITIWHVNTIQKVDGLRYKRLELQDVCLLYI